MNRTYLSLVLRLSAMLCITVALTGCMGPRTTVTKPTEAQALADALVYVKAYNGLCFGVGTTSRMDTGTRISYTNHVVHVPCAAVGL